MRVYDLFHSHDDSVYAMASSCRAMYEYDAYCKTCTLGKMARTYPMVMEWVVMDYELGSTVIADFTWVGVLNEIAVTDRVRQHLERNQASGISFGPVEMWQDPKLKRPKRITSRTKRRIWLPYEGPQLWDFITTGRAEIDYELSDVPVKSQCPNCGSIQRNFSGDKPLVFPKSKWDGSDFFLDRNHLRWVVFVTERGKAILDEGNFTNLVIKERGQIV